MRGDDSVGNNRPQSEPASGRECVVPPFAGPKLGVEIGGATEADDLLQEGNISREEDETLSVVGQKNGQGNVVALTRRGGRPMNRCDCPTKRSPSSLIGGERYDLLTVGNEMRPEYRTHSCGIAGALEVDCSIHSIGIGAGEREEPSLCRGLGE